MKLSVLSGRLSLFILTLFFSCEKEKQVNPDFVMYTADIKKDKIAFFWKNNHGQPFKSINSLKNYVTTKNQDLKFAMNGGMFIKNNIPKGLYIENFKTLHPIDTLNGEGNFYLKPNGIFYITSSYKSVIVPTADFKPATNIQFATQSGPMLIINKKINSVFQQNSNNLQIRNGVGILKNGNPVFVMSKKKISFYNFALLFKKLGCRDALYLDGFVSRTYLPEENWAQEDGDFGVIIGVATEKKNY